MQQVLSGFVIIVVIIGVGVILGRTRALGNNATEVLGNFVYLVATPALLFDKVTHLSLGEVFNCNFVVIVGSALITGVIFFAVYHFLAGRSVADSVIGMLAASYANAGNLGLPLAVYVLGDASLVIPVILFQIAFYAPVTMTWLDFVRRNPEVSVVRSLVATPLRNPMLISAVCGLAVSGLGVQLPAVVSEPIALLGGASVPLALVLFGLGLQFHSAWRKEVWAVVVFKNFLHPAIACALAWALGLHEHALLAAVILGCLPTAQNVYAYALRHKTNVALARDAGMVTTIVSFPVIVAASVVLG